MTNAQKKDLKKIMIAAVLYAVVIIFCTVVSTTQRFGEAGGFVVRLMLYLIPYLIVGWNVWKNAWRTIRRRDLFDENLLMLIATIGALGTGELEEAVAVMLFYQVGELFQSIAVGKSRQSVAALMDIMPEQANLLKGTEIVAVDPEDVLVGETIVIRPGERIPLDCRVLRGSSMIDTSSLTGESVPRRAEEGTELLSGCINGAGVLYAEVQKLFDDSTVSRILELVETASEKKAAAERFITRFAHYYTPAVVFAALALALIPPIFVGSFTTWVYRACIFLVVSCPCALVISVPMTFFSGIGAASRNGILVKGSNYLEQLAQMDTLVFDKTGTMTKGEFAVSGSFPQPGVSEEELLQLAAAAEVYSTHPVAAALRAAAGKTVFVGAGSSIPSDKAVKDLQSEAEVISAQNVNEIAGQGIHAEINGRNVYVGNIRLMQTAGIPMPEDVAPGNGVPATDGVASAGTVISVGADGRYLGTILISDTLKEGAAEAIRRLKQLGVRNHVMLTGDREATAAAVAAELGVDRYYAELLPADKVACVEELLFSKERSKKGTLAFAGDGINDAPVLMRADIGIAMGNIGSDAAIEAADVVLMDDRLLRLPLALRIAKKTVRIVRQNVVFALGVKFAVLVLSAFGCANMWAAVFADVGVAVIAILNAMRALTIRSER